MEYRDKRKDQVINSQTKDAGQYSVRGKIYPGRPKSSGLSKSLRPE